MQSVQPDCGAARSWLSATRRARISYPSSRPARQSSPPGIGVGERCIERGLRICRPLRAGVVEVGQRALFQLLRRRLVARQEAIGIAGHDLRLGQSPDHQALRYGQPDLRPHDLIVRSRSGVTPPPPAAAVLLPLWERTQTGAARHASGGIEQSELNRYDCSVLLHIPAETERLHQSCSRICPGRVGSLGKGLSPRSGTI